MAEPTRDPVHRARYAFEPEGEDIVVHTWLEPGGALPAHRHPRQEERWSVVEGQVRLQVGATKRVIGPEEGEVVVPANTKHSLESVGEGEARLRCLAIPALGLRAFLEESAAAAREGLFMRGGIPRSLRGARWAARFLARHQDDVIMSFPPLMAQRAMIATLGRSEAPRGHLSGSSQ